MSKKKLFNFNDVVDLYREGKTNEGCELLYDNIRVFINACKSITVNSCDRSDIESEVILEAHKSILKSLDRSYGQIYNYLKTRIMGRLKNYYTKEHSVLHNYYRVDIDHIDDAVESGVNNKVSNDATLKLILESILSLSDTEKEIIYLRVFNYPNKTLREISEISGINSRILSKKYVSAVKKIKRYLKYKGINYEDLF